MKQFWKVLKRFAAPYKRFLAGSVILNLLSAIFNIFSFALLIPILRIIIGFFIGCRLIFVAVGLPLLIGLIRLISLVGKIVLLCILHRLGFVCFAHVIVSVESILLC